MLTSLTVHDCFSQSLHACCIQRPSLPCGESGPMQAGDWRIAELWVVIQEKPQFKPMSLFNFIYLPAKGRQRNNILNEQNEEWHYKC